MMKKRKTHPLPATALLVLAGIMLGLGAAELSLRLWAPQYKTDRLFSIGGTRSPHSQRFRPSALFGYEMIPRCEPDINSFGMRDREYTLAKPAGTYRIVLLGDSITEHGAWSRYVEDRMNESGPCEILNCGVAGWGMANYRAYLRHKGLGFDPDLVLLGLCLNDMTGYGVSTTLLCDRRTGWGETFTLRDADTDTRLFLFMDTPLFRHSYLYRFVMARIIWARKGKAPAGDGKNALDALVEMKALAGGRVLAVVFPYLKPLKDYTPQERDEYDRTRGNLAAAGIDYLDLTPHFNRYGNDIVLFRERPDDQIHFNEDGNRLKAGIIHAWLTDRLRDARYRAR